MRGNYAASRDTARSVNVPGNANAFDSNAERAALARSLGGPYEIDLQNFTAWNRIIQ
jgi:hypothetical protein